MRRGKRTTYTKVTWFIDVGENVYSGSGEGDGKGPHHYL